MDDDGISEFSNTDDNVVDESSDANNEQIPHASGLQTSKQITNKRKLFVSPLKKNIPKKFQRSEDPRINQAFNILKTIEAKKNESSIKDDDCDTFGKYVASELKTFDEHIRAQIKHALNNVLYEAHMSKFQKQIPHNQPILNWNFPSPKAPPATLYQFPNQQFYQQPSPQQYASPTTSIIQQTSPQHYLSPCPSTLQQPVRDNLTNSFTSQEKSSHSSDSSVSSYYQTFTDQNSDVLNGD